jgi:hypothetical protein
MLSFFLCPAMHSLIHVRYEYSFSQQPLMNGVTAMHRISCTAIEPRHGRGGTARKSIIELNLRKPRWRLNDS